MMRNPLEQYRQVQVQTSSTPQIVVLLCDAALGTLSRAEQALVEKRLDLVSTRLIWTQKVVLELLSVLDLEKGGKLAADLRELYVFLYRTLVDANVRKDAEAIGVVKRLLTTLRDAWRASIEAPVPGAASEVQAAA